jgi:hypothetical protein
MSRSETSPQPKHREQPHVIADRVSRRLGANRIRLSLGLPPLPVTTSPEYPRPLIQGEEAK